MNKILIMLTIFLVFGCKSEQRKSLSELASDQELSKQKSKKPELKIVFDTLVFDEKLNGELLNKKFDQGLKELQFYKHFVSENKIAEKQIMAEEHSKSEIIYLGKLIDLDKKNFYHVITNFRIIGIDKMESPRGISNIVFFNESSNKVIIYNMGLPENLPDMIENNILYFTFKSEKVGISISGGLPPMLCLPKIGCN